jgi:hypothetical protein
MLSKGECRKGNRGREIRGAQFYLKSGAAVESALGMDFNLE